MYKEGSANVYNRNAFVNDAAKLTRDIGTAIALEFSGSRDYSALDATAATGIRGIRYCLESRVKSCTFLEINRTAYPTLKKNLAKNKIMGTALNTSVQEFANSSKDRFDIIDLDPFGGIQPYVYDLMKVAKDGSLFFATATDTAVLCGAHSNACMRLYGALPMHNELCREVGLRILLGYVVRIAASFNFGTEPLMSIVYLHYMRLHTRLKHGSKNAVSSMKELGFIEYCNNCGHRGVQKGMVPKSLTCGNCSSKVVLGGPLWTGRLHNKDIVKKVCDYATENGANKGELSLLEEVRKEMDEQMPYDIPRITKFLKVGSVSPYGVVDRLTEAGHSASFAHFGDSCIRTDASIDDITKIIKQIRGGRAH